MNNLNKYYGLHMDLFDACFIENSLFKYSEGASVQTMKIAMLLVLSCHLFAVDVLQPDDDGVIRPKWNPAGITMPQLKNGVDQALPVFKPATGIKGLKIKSVGSDAVNNIMALTGELIQSYYKDTIVEIEGKGGATAPAALGSGWANIGPHESPI